MKQSNLIKDIFGIIFINVSVLFLFIFILEILYRSYRTFSECKEGYCNFKQFQIRGINNINKLQDSLYKKHSILGYVPKENKSNFYTGKFREKILVSTDKYGLRESTTNSKINQNKLKILTVGNSFTFGDEVSNEFTWQSCLNLKQDKYNFLNGGVNGYGTAQAIFRANILSENIKPSKILVSTLVGSNFKRDQFKLRNGYPIPSVIKRNGNLSYSDPIFDILGINPIFNPNQKKSNNKIRDFNFLDFILENSSISNRLFPNLRKYERDLRYSRLTKKHEKAANKEDIIKWSIENSLKLDRDVIWLLQYNSLLTKESLNEREFIINTLNNKNIKFIDTYNVFHYLNEDENFKLKAWVDGTGHHSKFGNSLVCNAILSKINNFEK